MSIKINTVDMHTGGEPLRIITSGYPAIKGNTILEKRRFISEHLDHYRRMLIHEPRGHYDQYGVLLVPSNDPQADIGAIFMHNEGYSTMCGHAIIALGRYIVDNKLHKAKCTEDTGSVTEVTTNILCPCGMIEASVNINNGVTGAVKFTSVPAFAYKTDIHVTVPNYGDILLDIGYGGAFYALVNVDQVKLDLSNASCSKLVDFASAVTQTVKEQIDINHPEEVDLSFLYGTILTDGKDAYSSEPTYNLCVFADRQVDRSPCGSGVTARLAVHYAKRLIGINEQRTFRNSKLASEFIGEVVVETKCGSLDAVRVQVQGEAYYTGTSQFFLEENDHLKHGFVVR